MKFVSFLLRVRFLLFKQILDLCVQNCGPNFHKELGKFKFLNELMKVLLPKVSKHTTLSNHI